MKSSVSYSWKGVGVMLAVLTVFVVSAQAFALSSGPDEHRQVDATSQVEPTASLFEINQMDIIAGISPNIDQTGRMLNMGVDPGLMGASGHTEADPPGTVEASTSTEVTLSARVRDPSGVIGTVAFTFEIEAPPDVLDLPAGDVLVGFPAVFPTQRVTLEEETSSIPEPAVLVLVGLGVLGLALLRRRWGRKTHP
jgi:hypothetical protein